MGARSPERCCLGDVRRMAPEYQSKGKAQSLGRAAANRGYSWTCGDRIGFDIQAGNIVTCGIFVKHWVFKLEV